MIVDAKHEAGSGDLDVARTMEPMKEARASDLSEVYVPGSPATGHDLVPVADGHAMAPIEDIIDVQAVARLLHVGRNTVYELVARNQIPHRRLRKQIRFSRAAIMRWFASWSPQDAKERQ